jgi:hypothetical protein
MAHSSVIRPVQACEEPQWTGYIDEIELAAQRGACFLDLGRHTPAERKKFGCEAADALRVAIEGIKMRAPERMRDLVHYMIRLASAYALQDEPFKAVSIAEEASILAEYIGSARVSKRFDELVALLCQYDVPSVCELIERLRHD